MDAAVSTRIVQRVAHGASVTKRKKVFSVLIWLGADAQHLQVDTFLKLDWNLKILQQCHRMFCRLVCTQCFGVFHKRINHCELTDAS